MPSQETIFLQGEGDAWFRRNHCALDPAQREATDYPLALLHAYHLRPQRVLEVGCSNGWRLHALQQRYGCACVGVEPSAEALAAGRSQFPAIEFRSGMAASLPCPPGETFDVVIVYFILHWVDRQALLTSLAEIDRVVADGGYVLLGDFLPDAPQRNRYAHRSDVEVYTYKLDYAAILESSALYTNVARLTFDHDHHKYAGAVGAATRGVCQLLRKSTSEFYRS